MKSIMVVKKSIEVLNQILNYFFLEAQLRVQAEEQNESK